ncbi:MAG: hypothetical protein JSS69_16965 [Acidobacteria bacterium]|nr:hypothetical protein [Acidobacteriota bacterium]MBS1867607.1 hypothetical protein [Acidobacteriota bacterium]
MRAQVFFSAVLLATFPSIGSAQQQSHMRRATEQSGGFMQGGMHHKIAATVMLGQTINTTAHTITLRVGPLTLPANTSHMNMPQPRDLTWTIPLTGWLLSYHPRIVDASGNSVPGTVLHHVAFWNENRSDFLCPNKEEHIFGAGGELTDWANIPGYGYRVQKNDRIRIETMIHNPTPTSYDKAFLEIEIRYLDDASPAPVKDFYPAWMDVEVCGNSGYDLPAGPSEKSGSIAVKFDGVLLGVGGHMHDYARQIVLENTTHKETIATLQAKTDDKGHLQYMPVVTFFAAGGQKISAGDRLKITASYDNPTGKLLREGAMGIVVGYFVPSDDGLFAAFRHAAKTPEHNMHDMHDMKDMPGMAHDQ